MKTPEKSVEEIVEELRTYFADPKWTTEEVENAITQTLQAERQRCDEMVEDILKMADTLEIECGKDGDKGTKQWIAFKGFRNTIRDKYLTQPNNK